MPSSQVFKQGSTAFGLSGLRGLVDLSDKILALRFWDLLEFPMAGTPKIFKVGTCEDAAQLSARGDS